MFIIVQRTAGSSKSSKEDPLETIEAVKLETIISVLN